MFLSKIRAFTLQPVVILFCVAAFTLAYFVFAHEGFYWLDDYIYTKYAWQLQQGIFDFNNPILPPNPITNRVMSFAPAAIFYALFGLNIYTATLWPLLCTLGCSLLIFALYRKRNPLVAVFGILSLGLYFHTLFLATYFYPDNILMFFAFASAAVLYRFRFIAEGRRPLLHATLFVLCNFLAFLSKETIVYYAPFYLVLFLSDFFGKKPTVFWLYSFVLGALVLTAYFTFYYFETGDFLHRFHIIEETNAAYHEGEEPKPLSQIIFRLTQAPFWLFMGSGIYVPFVLALGLLFKTRFRNLIRAQSPESFWLLLALVVLAQFWFGSTSLKYYNPITLLPRMCMLLMPPLCLAAAYGLVYFLKGSRNLAAIFALLFGLAAWLEGGNMLVMYVPLTLFFGAYWWQFRKPTSTAPVALTVLVLTAVLVLRPLHFMRKPSMMGFQEQNAVIKNHLTGLKGNTLVISDPWLKFMHDFHYDFKPSQQIHFQAYNDTIPAQQNYRQVFLLVNRAALSHPDMVKMQVVQEPEINQLFPQKTLIEQKGQVLLYQIK